MNRSLQDLSSGVVGTGFIGAVHIDALRRLGVQIAGVVGSSPERAAAKGLATVYRSYDELLADDRVDVVHLTTPNYLHYREVKKALDSGKHVVCEKPLAMTSAESAELVKLAERSGLVHCTNFNVRFYPLVQEARARIAAGDLGEIWNVHGGYLQDWLALPTDWNWRLEPEKGGELRAVADIGSHWLDLVQFVTGLRIVEIFADLATVIPVRQRPAGELETFAAADDVARVDQEMASEDVAHLLLRLENGARGSCVISQVSFGRKNAPRFEITGSRASIAWAGERNEELWIGHRDRGNEVFQRNPALMYPAAAARTHLPVAHAEGFSDTFRELYRAVYRDIIEGRPSPEPDYPTFRDGHIENVLCGAIARSHREGSWIEL